MNTLLILVLEMGKWDIVRRPKIKAKERELPEICRVVPPTLARIPNIFDWLFKQRQVGTTNRVGLDLRIRYREIADMIKFEKLNS